jgi:hypothetical protein
MPSGKSAAGDDDRAVPEPPLEVGDLLRHGFVLRARRAEVAMQHAAVVHVFRRAVACSIASRSASRVSDHPGSGSVKP